MFCLPGRSNDDAQSSHTEDDITMLPRSAPCDFGNPQNAHLHASLPRVPWKLRTLHAHKPILSFWIAQNYEAALIAIARRAVDALPARDGLSSNDCEMPDLGNSSSSSSRDEVPFVVDEESSNNEFVVCGRAL